jgi:hypothetical protein
VTRYLDARHSRHADIEQYDLGREARRQRDGFASRAAASTNTPTFELVDEPPEALSGRHLVVDD